MANEGIQHAVGPFHLVPGLGHIILAGQRIKHLITGEIYDIPGTVSTLCPARTLKNKSIVLLNN